MSKNSLPKLLSLLFAPLTLLADPITAPDDMVWIEGATYTRGTPENPKLPHNPEERPVHPVTVAGFFIDIHEVTNAQFQKFVDATDYVTQAEKGWSAEEFPKAPPEMLVPGAIVFSGPPESVELWKEDAVWQWWRFEKGASWKHPLGPNSNLDGKENHPVVCVTWEDAQAYAQWAGKRLPTEAEWELAARGGEKGLDYIWGNESKPGEKWLANVFTGEFPHKDTAEDGFSGTAPIKSYPPNPFGLHDMAGNVWEHCSDLYRPDFYEAFSKKPKPNPTGPTKGISQPELNWFLQHGNWPKPVIFGDPHPLSVLHVTRGGSFLCHTSYCLRYRPGARHYSESLAPANHTGFRCAKSKPETDK